MRAFVTGGTGLVGRHIVEALLAHGWEVSILTRNRARAKDLEARGVRIVAGDVTRATFGSGMSHADVVFHAAGWFELGVRDARRMFDVNVTGTANVLTLARRENVPRIVVTGTAGVFAAPGSHGPLTESMAPSSALRDPYVSTKREAHQLVVGEMHSGLPVTLVCPGGVFGPGDTGQLGRTLALLVIGRLRTLPRGLGRNTFTHAADIAEGHLLAAAVGKAGETYLLGDRVLPLEEFFRLAAEAAGVDPPKRHVPMVLARLAARGSEVRARFGGKTPLLSRGSLELSTVDVVVDSTKARTQLGWNPRSFGERLRETMAWYAETYRDRLARLPVKPGGASA
ncbi:MAG TPA: NAD-dependent epimerase/dehydratase family protein [Thermoplasmata archaeon]|nr:NAD-dependent epimerase/dehydratase family protein [Thermoplasmata archaeon]